jgi:two-component system chemotaxis sensor kinase CheA
MVASVLGNAGYQTLVARDGEQAFRMLIERPTDLVVSDVEMPNLDGIGLVQKIRQSESLKKIPVILLTSLGSTEDRARGAQAGADGYMVKSAFDPSAFLAMVADHLRDA